MSDLKQRLVSRLKQVGACDVRIADPNAGFEYALEGQHSLALAPGGWRGKAVHRGSTGG